MPGKRTGNFHRGCGGNDETSVGEFAGLGFDYAQEHGNEVRAPGVARDIFEPVFAFLNHEKCGLPRSQEVEELGDIGLVSGAKNGRWGV